MAAPRKTAKTAPAPEPPGPRRWLAAHRASKVSEIVARDIVDDIARRKLAPGSKLPPETTMLEKYQVGRASLREALRILEVHGLLHIKPGPGGGPIVNRADSEHFGRSTTLFYHAAGATIGDLIEARLVIEPMMARLAAERITSQGAATLQEVLADERTADHQHAGWGEASGGFHSIVASMTGNVVLDLLGRSLIEVLTARVRSVFPAETKETTLRTHERIANAIMAGNADEAERLTRKHVTAIADTTRKSLPSIYNEAVDWH